MLILAQFSKLPLEYSS